MSVSEAGTASGVQPEAGGAEAPAGDGQGIAGLGLYDLSAAPEELRPFLEQELKKVDGEVTKKFQEHADFRKQWEPLEQIEGLSDVPAEELAELVQFREIASDPEQFEQWWESVGDKFGFFEGEGPEGGEELGGDGGEEMPAWAQGLLDKVESLEGQLAPVNEHLSAQERKDAVAAAEREIADEFAKLEQEHELDDDAKQAIGQLALSYGGEPDSIAKGFADWQKITGQAQGELADDKLGQPRPAVTGGQPGTEPEKFEGLNDPKLKAAAKQRLAAAARG